MKVDWNEEEISLFYNAQEIARRILSGEVDPVEGCEMIDNIRIQLNFPEELQYWAYLNDGGSAEWEDKTWIPGLLKYNHEKWLESVMRNARYLAAKEFLDSFVGSKKG